MAVSLAELDWDVPGAVVHLKGQLAMSLTRPQLPETQSITQWPSLFRYLDWSIRETSGIRKQDAPHVFKAVAKNDIGLPIAKNFLKERGNDMRK
ncbi:hypothetical protein RUM44_005292 [Polyplax serrata]|uniref:Uncharacterized protein n=1 Tax=Polyplax serrata TaxID=468196 RepID=A0ABR1AEM5_POLSC